MCSRHLNELQPWDLLSLTNGVSIHPYIFVENILKSGKSKSNYCNIFLNYGVGEEVITQQYPERGFKAFYAFALFFFLATLDSR